MPRIDGIRFVAAKLGARKIADLGRIHDADDMASLPQCQGDAEAVASGCLQARVHPFDLQFLKPGQQLAPTAGRMGKTFWRAAWPLRKLDDTAKRALAIGLMASSSGWYSANDVEVTFFIGTFASRA